MILEQLYTFQMIDGMKLEIFYQKKNLEMIIEHPLIP